MPLRNPLTGQSYANGVVPFSDPSVSAFAKGVLAALPAPNVPGNPFANNYASLPADTLDDNKGDIRVDQTFSPKTTAFARDSQHEVSILSPPNIQGPAGGNSNGSVKIFNQQIAGGVTRTLTQNAILDARFAFTRTDGGKFPYGQTLPSLMAGIPGLPTDPDVVRSLNVQSVNGFSQFGNQGSNPQFQNPYVYNPKANFTLLHGRNSYKSAMSTKPFSPRMTISTPSTVNRPTTAVSATRAATPTHSAPPTLAPARPSGSPTFFSAHRTATN